MPSCYGALGTGTTLLILFNKFRRVSFSGSQTLKEKGQLFQWRSHNLNIKQVKMSTD